jgi:signal peptidase I
LAEEYTDRGPETPGESEERDLSLSHTFGIRSWLQDTLETILLAVILFFAINALTGRYQVHGQSMVPSLHEGQYLIASKVAYWLHEPARGDVIVLDPPNNNGGIPYIKRVIGLPGDVVEVRENRVWVNGIALNEPYINTQPNYNGNWIVDKNTVFVLGDNRNDSSDSHTWGLLPHDHILGKAFFSYWPPEWWGTIPHYTFPELSGTQ